MSERSEKEARENADLVALLAPVLAATALLSYFKYRALKKQFPTFFPALRTVPLAEIAQLTREDGNKLHIAGEFGSYSLRFSDKRRRDECIYLLKSRTGAKMLADLE